MEQQPFERANEPASFWLRVLAKLTDLLILNSIQLMLFCCTALLHAVGVAGLPLLGAFWMVSAVIFVGYFAYRRSEGRQSLGQRLAGIRLFSVDDGPIGFWRSLWRASLDCAFLSLVGFYLIGLPAYLMVAFTQSNRALHDILSGTRVAQVAPPQRLHLGLGSVMSVVLPLIAVFLFVRPYFIQSFYTPSEAMRPTLAVNDRFLVNKLCYRLREPRRGDIAIFQAPPEALINPNEKKILIKRIIGVPGDVVEVHRKDDGKNAVFINGKPMNEPYIAEPPDYEMKIVDDRIYEIQPYSQFPVQRNCVPVEDSREVERVVSSPPGRVPPGTLVVLGDNRNDSNDSHKWGFLPTRNLLGRAMLVYSPRLQEL